MTPEHAVVVWAGRFGALRFARLHVESEGRRPPWALLEVNTLPYGCRRQGNAEVRIVFRATQLFAAALTPEATAAIVPVLQRLFPVLRPAGSMVEAAFRNSAIPVLAVGALLNVGAIEARGREFSLFRDGMTPTVRQVIRAVHREMIAVGAAMGFAMPAYPDEIYEGVASIEGANFRDEAGGLDGFLRLTGPDRVQHRYTIENVRYGLAVVSALGRRHRTPTPTIDALCGFADVICGPEFAKLGWLLSELGLD
jgi:opine dehydrogenase